MNQTLTALLFAHVLAAFSSPTLALEAHQRDAIERLAAGAGTGRTAAAAMARHYAVLLWVEDYCNGRSAEAVRALILDKGRVDQDAFEAGWMDTFDVLAKTEPKAMCALALEQYGPEGALIKGAWRPKG